MESPQFSVLTEIFIETTIYSLLLFTIVAFIVGILLLLAPHKMEPIKKRFDRWLTPRKALKPLEIPRHIEPFFYLHHRWIGAIAIILPIITVYLLLYSVADELPQNMVSKQEQYLFWQWLFESSVLFLWISNIFAFVIGVTLFFHPSGLKRVEAIANLWLSTRQGLRKFDQYYSQLDELMLKRSRSVGIFLLFGSLYIFMAFLMFMLQHPDWLDLFAIQLYKS